MQPRYQSARMSREQIPTCGARGGLCHNRRQLTSVSPAVRVLMPFPRVVKPERMVYEVLGTWKV